MAVSLAKKLEEMKAGHLVEKMGAVKVVQMDGMKAAH